MKTTVHFIFFATMLSCVPAIAGQPSLCQSQSGVATRQSCSNLEGIITGELSNISVLDKLNNKEIDADKAINLILGAQKYIQSNYVDTIYAILVDNLEEGDRKFAKELQPRIVNVYKKCDLWVNQFQALKPESVSKTDYDNIANYCKVEPQNLYDTYCKPMDEGKCADKGEKVGVTIFNDFKRKTGGVFCGRFQEIDSFIQNKLISNPVCDCDDAFNNAATAYIDKQLQQAKENCDNNTLSSPDNNGSISVKKISMPGGEYEGEVRDGKMHGKGMFYYTNNSRFEGDFRDDIAEGVLYYNNGEKFSGKLKPTDLNDLESISGTGVFYDEAGNKFTGDINQGIINGNFKFINGDYFYGKIDFKSIKETRRDSLLDAENIIYVDGSGKITNSDFLFQGEIKNGRMKGNVSHIKNGDFVRGDIDAVKFLKHRDFSGSEMFVKLSIGNEIFEGHINDKNAKGKFCKDNVCFDFVGKFENGKLYGIAEAKTPDGLIKRARIDGDSIQPLD